MNERVDERVPEPLRMPMFTTKKAKREADVPRGPIGSVEQIHPLVAVPPLMSAGDAARFAFPISCRLANNRRLFLVLAGNDVDNSGRCDEWSFHYVYPDDHCESVITITSARRSPTPGTAAAREKVTPWPAPGSPQEAMVLFQGPTARIIVEQQWADRLERLPGLPDMFIDSTDAADAVHATGADLAQGGGGIRMKGRTPPGRLPVWEIVAGFETYHTPFA